MKGGKTMDDDTTTTREQLLLRPGEAAARLGIGRTKLYELMGSGALRSVKIGGARRVSATALTEFVTALDAA
jgi:excisionase family DNA binding protein